MGMGVAAAVSIGSKVVMGTMNARSAMKREARYSIAQNKAIQKYNEKVQYENLQMVNQANLQRSALIGQQQQALHDVQLNAQAQESMVNVQNGATESTGASVQDAIAAVRVNQSLDKGELDNQFAEAVEAHRLQTNAQLRQGEYNLKDAYKDQSGAAFREGMMGVAGTLAADLTTEWMSQSLKGEYKARDRNLIAPTNDLYGKRVNPVSFISSTLRNAGRARSVTNAWSALQQYKNIGIG